ncbi:RNA polymerase II C-terminal domain kinase beta subunit [Savitreella phatthalungensis]
MQGPPALSDAPPGVVVRLSQPFLGQDQVDALAAKAAIHRRGSRTTARLAAGDVLAVAGRLLQFPSRTIVAAMTVWARFDLLDPTTADYRPDDLTSAALFFACKLEDTPKKSKEVIAAIFHARHGRPMASKQDLAQLEEQRQRVLSLERIMLENQSFDFRKPDTFTHMVKLAKQFRIPRLVARRAWDVCSDCHRTWLPLKVTTCTLAVAALECAASLLDPDSSLIQMTSSDLVERLGTTEKLIHRAMLDIYDLYLNYPGNSLVGLDFGQDRLLELKARLHRKMADGDAESNRLANGAGGRASAPALPEPSAVYQQLTDYGNRGTCRFVLDEQRPREELHAVRTGVLAPSPGSVSAVGATKPGPDRTDWRHRSNDPHENSQVAPRKTVTTKSMTTSKRTTNMTR